LRGQAQIAPRHAALVVLGQEEVREMTTDDFCAGIAEHACRAGIPIGDGTLAIERKGRGLGVRRARRLPDLLHHGAVREKAIARSSRR
jgi:hypothetical protein